MNTELQDFASTLSHVTLTGDTLTLRGGIKIKCTQTENGKWCVEVNGTKTTGAKLKITFQAALAKVMRGLNEAANAVEFAQYQIKSAGLMERFREGCKVLPGEMIADEAYGDRAQGRLTIHGYDPAIHISLRESSWSMYTTPAWATSFVRSGTLAVTGGDAKTVFSGLMRKLQASAAKHIAESSSAVTHTTSLIARLETLVAK